MDAQTPKTIELGFTFALQDDFARCIPHLGAPDPKDRQFWRRTACRSFFGALEAIISVQRQHFILDMVRDKGREWLKGQEVCEYFVPIYGATESHEFVLNENGTAKFRPKRLGFLATLKAVVRMSLFLSDVPKADVEKLLGGKAWDQVKKATKVRDRIMHPHKHGDVTITDEELRAIFDTSKWLQDFLGRLRMEDVMTKYGDCTDDGEAVS